MRLAADRNSHAGISEIEKLKMLKRCYAAMMDGVDVPNLVERFGSDIYSQVYEGLTAAQKREAFSARQWGFSFWNKQNLNPVDNEFTLSRRK